MVLLEPPPSGQAVTPAAAAPAPIAAAAASTAGGRSSSSTTAGHRQHHHYARHKTQQLSKVTMPSSPYMVSPSSPRGNTEGRMVMDLLSTALTALSLTEENRQAAILDLKELSGLTMATIKVSQDSSPSICRLAQWNEAVRAWMDRYRGPDMYV